MQQNYRTRIVVAKYTDDLKDMLGAKVEPQAWLHCAILVSNFQIQYAIYVWDTRKVIGSDILRATFEDIDWTKVQLAKDSRQELNGSGESIYWISACLVSKAMLYRLGAYGPDLAKKTVNNATNVNFGDISFNVDNETKRQFTPEERKRMQAYKNSYDKTYIDYKFPWDKK
jgi:hypothetical protein